MRSITVPPVRPDGLQLVEHRGFQNRFWKLQRAAWALYALVMLASLLGFSGSGGPFHNRVLQFDGGTIELPRVARWEGSDEIKVTFRAANTLTIGKGFFDSLAVQRIQPEPTTLLRTGGQEMRFDGAGVVSIQIRPQHYGMIMFDLGVGDDSRPVRLLVLP